MSGIESAAKRSVTHTLKNGKTYELMQLDFEDMLSLQDQCLKDWKTNALSTYTECLTGLTPEERMQLIREEARRIETVSYEDLPDKTATLIDIDDSGNVIRDENGMPLKVRKTWKYLEYWCRTFRGMVHTVWKSMRKAPGQENVGFDEAVAIFQDRQDELLEVASLVDKLSENPLSKNSSAPEDGAARRRRRRRRGRKSSD